MGARKPIQKSSSRGAVNSKGGEWFRSCGIFCRAKYRHAAEARYYLNLTALVQVLCRVSGRTVDPAGMIHPMDQPRSHLLWEKRGQEWTGLGFTARDFCPNYKISAHVEREQMWGPHGWSRPAAQYLSYLFVALGMWMSRSIRWK